MREIGGDKEIHPLKPIIKFSDWYWTSSAESKRYYGIGSLEE